MPWQERSTLSLRREFVELACQPGANTRALCRRFEISPKTGYKWLNRYAQAMSAEALRDHSRQPHTQPARSAPEIEAAVVALRHAHPAWGGRKIARRLFDRDSVTIAPSTVTAILHRHSLIQSAASQAGRALAALRTCSTQHAVANRLQRPFTNACREVPRPDDARRSFPLQPHAQGLRTHGCGFSPAGTDGCVPALWLACTDQRG